LHEARWFPRGAVATPHHLATSAGVAVLARGGNAVDAAVAANLVLGVVTPYFCGPGGDLLAQVWDGRLHGYVGVGRAPAAASIDAVRASAASAGDADVFPTFGAHTVTVPGAVRGWFDLLERFGTRSFGDLAADAIRHADEGFELTRKGAWFFRQCRLVYDHFGFGDFAAAYPDAAPGAWIRQPELARTLRVLAADGPGAFYAGPIGEAAVAKLRAEGAPMTTDDLARHEGEFVTPLCARFGSLDVTELPPPSQGVAALLAMRVAERLGLPDDGPDRQHLMIEAVKVALGERDRHVADPATMTVTPGDLLDDAHVARMAAGVDPRSAAAFPPSDRPDGGTAYLCAADGDGGLVSLIQSNFFGTGSGLVVDGWGVHLHNRGSTFRLDPAHPQAIGPRRRPMHTLIPAMGLRDGMPVLVFGTEGGHGQLQTQLQVLVRLEHDGADLQDAITAPRWYVDPGSGAVRVEDRFGDELADELRARGHDVTVDGAFRHGMGYAHAIAPTSGGFRAASDPRAEGGAGGL
jgi:gamma-glutamyltranspeptidase/glutathione hydrolase